MRSRTTAAAVTGALTAALVLPTASAAADPVIVASTLGTDTNLVASSNTAPQPFSSRADGFGVYQRGVSDSIPFALLDDSLSFSSDSLGIVDGDDTHPFHGSTDTVNDDNDGPLTTTWTFDVSTATGPLFLNIEAGAMGDFEASSDLFEFAATLDGTDAGTATVEIDEDGTRTYTLQDGDSFTEADPANLLGTELDDDFKRVSLPLTGDGDELVVSFTGDTNGGSEAFAFTNLVVTQDEPLPPLDGGEEPNEPTACDTPVEDLTRISDIQGDGFATPLPSSPTRTGSKTDDEYTVRGVVTFADNDLEGIFVQEEPDDEDGEPATSEGIFVFFGDRAEDYPVGSTVEMTDEVDERFGLTQMAFPAIEVCDVAPIEITPTDLTLPADDVAREALEGMLVTTTQQLDVTGLFSEFGEIGVTAQDAPLIQPTAELDPDDPAAAAVLAEQEANLLKLDDRGEFDAAREPWAQPPSGIGPRPGDTIAAGVTGPLTFTFDDYKIEPLTFPTVTAQGENPRPDAPQVTGGNDIAAFNVLNYFNDFGDSAVLRGATNQTDFELQTAKIVEAVNTLDAAVLGLVELENDYEDLYDGDPSTEAAIVTLVDALNADAGFAKWDFVAPGEDLLTDEGLGGGGLGTDAIAVGIIYQPDRAHPTGSPATFDIDAELTGDSDNNRWPLAQSFQVEGPGPDVTVVVNHFKSKGSSCADTAGPGFALGEDVGSALLGNCDLTRQYAADQLLAWLDTRPTGVDHDRTLVTGDLNAYDEEAPVRIFEDAGWTDLVEELGDDAFTYKFDGRYGRLDHALASPDLRKFIRDAAVWQVNSLEYYNNLYSVAPIDASAYASSDHDPVVVSMDHPGRGDGHVAGPGRGRGGNTRGR